MKVPLLYGRESPCTNSYSNCGRRNWKPRLHDGPRRQNVHFSCDFLGKGKVNINSSGNNNLLSFSHSTDVPFFFAIALSKSSQEYVGSNNVIARPSAVSLYFQCVLSCLSGVGSCAGMILTARLSIIRRETTSLSFCTPVSCSVRHIHYAKILWSM